MKKYEEENYRFENIKDKIYPWVREEYYDREALNGKHLSEKTTTALAYLGNLKIFFAIKRGEDSYEIIEDHMLPPETDMTMLFHLACENMVRDIDFVMGNTMYGAYAIIADGFHETSSILLKHIWDMCVEKLKDDLIIAIPTKDTLLFAEKSKLDIEKFGKTFFQHCKLSKDQPTADPISDQLLIYSYEKRELSLYSENVK